LYIFIFALVPCLLLFLGPKVAKKTISIQAQRQLVRQVSRIFLEIQRKLPILLGTVDARVEKNSSVESALVTYCRWKGWFFIHVREMFVKQAVI
jgi:hypothetical protein